MILCSVSASLRRGKSRDERRHTFRHSSVSNSKNVSHRFTILVVMWNGNVRSERLLAIMSSWGLTAIVSVGSNWGSFDGSATRLASNAHLLPATECRCTVLAIDKKQPETAQRTRDLRLSRACLLADRPTLPLASPQEVLDGNEATMREPLTRQRFSASSQPVGNRLRRNELRVVPLRHRFRGFAC